METSFAACLDLSVGSMYHKEMFAWGFEPGQVEMLQGAALESYCLDLSGIWAAVFTRG